MAYANLIATGIVFDILASGSHICLMMAFSEHQRWLISVFYSETTWAVGISQLTHHEVQGGGKNPETGGRGIFAPTADRVVS